jgi:hypothetical protein
MIYQRMFNERNTTGVTSREGIDYLPVYMNSALIFNGVRVSQFLVFWEVFCRSMFAFLSIFVIVLFVILWLPDSDYSLCKFEASKKMGKYFSNTDNLRTYWFILNFVFLFITF